MQEFKPADLQKKTGSIFNSVQANGSALITNRQRPEMVITLKSEYDALIEKVRQLTQLVKAQ